MIGGMKLRIEWGDRYGEWVTIDPSFWTAPREVTAFGLPLPTTVCPTCGQEITADEEDCFDED